MDPNEARCLLGPYHWLLIIFFIGPIIQIDLAQIFKFKNLDVGSKIESNFMCTSQIP
jgi:hypothetical protein